MHGRLSTHTNYSFLRARGGGKPLTLAMHCALCTMHNALITYGRWWEVAHTYYAQSTRELLTLAFCYAHMQLAHSCAIFLFYLVGQLTNMQLSIAPVFFFKK